MPIPGTAVERAGAAIIAASVAGSIGAGVLQAKVNEAGRNAVKTNDEEALKSALNSDKHLMLATFGGIGALAAPMGVGFVTEVIASNTTREPLASLRSNPKAAVLAAAAGVGAIAAFTVTAATGTGMGYFHRRGFGFGS